VTDKHNAIDRTHSRVELLNSSYGPVLYGSAISAIYSIPCFLYWLSSFITHIL